MTRITLSSPINTNTTSNKIASTLNLVPIVQVFELLFEVKENKVKGKKKFDNVIRNKVKILLLREY
jgi:hypothetical protein